MPRINPELRARQCKFTYSDGRRCRLARSAAGEGYCYSHARKILEERKSAYIHAILTEPLAHTAVSSTALSLVLVRLFTAVSADRLPAKTANSLLRITQALQKTLPDTTHEFSQVFQRSALTDTIRALYQEQDDFFKHDHDDPANSEWPAYDHAAAASPVPPPRHPRKLPLPPLPKICAPPHHPPSPIPLHILPLSRIFLPTRFPTPLTHTPACPPMNSSATSNNSIPATNPAFQNDIPKITPAFASPAKPISRNPLYLPHLQEIALSAPPSVPRSIVLKFNYLLVISCKVGVGEYAATPQSAAIARVRE
jgi:hypothetical protein